MQSQLEELLPFLHDRNPQARQVALANLVGHTAKESPNRGIFFQGAGGGVSLKDSIPVRDLKLLCRDQPAIAHDAFKALVNLSDSMLLASSLSEKSFLTFLISYVANTASLLADLASMLLSNLTAFPIAAKALLSLNVPVISLRSASFSGHAVGTTAGLPSTLYFTSYYAPESRCMTSAPPLPYPSDDPTDVNAILVLVDAFTRAASGTVSISENDPDKKADAPESIMRKGELHFLASVFANVSVYPAARQIFLTPAPSEIGMRDKDSAPLEYPLSKLVAFTEHPNIIRRRGVVSTIKNCAFDTSKHKVLLAPERSIDTAEKNAQAGVGLLPAILLPLAGPEEFDLEEMESLPPALQFLPPTKRRELDPLLRLTHVETLLLLCTTRKGRESLRENGVYLVVRALHLVETDERVGVQILRLVSLLKRDEGEETMNEGDEQWDETRIDRGEGDESDEDEKVIEI
ncbi:uncharacterized protein EI90DRAFT_2975172 [Cantharellus anzutake]|uniref:uncharacterized protein n=1 Tax=Cantharellus anzutake TaxID=1750568 RepID=UPI0019034AFD|nr:uncharacterized protein EI90DRAFT_2975172 [Cantharellus anzutake]KAF8327178.1 hypothetical protein EI90DRAFT_2975172 [Cantharellus anzutake]